MWMPSVSWPIKQAVNTAKTMEKSRAPLRRMAVRWRFVYYILYFPPPFVVLLSQRVYTAKPKTQRSYNNIHYFIQTHTHTHTHIYIIYI